MENLLRCLVLCLIHGTSCQLFFETIVPRRSWKNRWVRHTAIPAFAAGGLIISLTPVPPYFLQPVRLVLILAIVAQIYFQVRITRNLMLSVVFCAVYWGISTAVISIFYLFLDFAQTDASAQALENLTEAFVLALMTAFHCHYKSRLRGLVRSPENRLGALPLLCLITLVAFNTLSTEHTTANRYAIFVTVFGLAILGIFLFYLVMQILEKEETLRRLQLGAERTRSQMELYHVMQKHYEQQRRFLHDYKNQLNCVQGLIECGQTQEACAYITRMTGTLRTQFGDINTNHAVVNIILKQKYQTARDKNIPMTFVINDLSGLTMPEEHLVTLLANLLDNALEACERLRAEQPSASVVIQFKMVLEENQLIVSVRNPVSRPVPIKNNTVVTSKNDSAHHGIGLSNVDFVVRTHNGTSVLKCTDGWFSFSAVFP
ncbi:MAG: GHKL domain-containing protein [Lachnospiraceae bacterium]|nr:GHKL domain-containing protein [Lachnospiraceae bacterium]